MGFWLKFWLKFSDFGTRLDRGVALALRQPGRSRRRRAAIGVHWRSAKPCHSRARAPGRIMRVGARCGTGESEGRRGEAADQSRAAQDVTLEVFRHLRGDEALRARYLAAIDRGDGFADESLRSTLHRRIGKRVKAVLGAEVVGRSLPLDPAVELIRSFALLRAPGADA